MAYLTREQAAAELITGGSTTESAGALLDSALTMYPQSVRTNYYLVTGYREGTCMGAWPAGCITEDLFTIGRW